MVKKKSLQSRTNIVYLLYWPFFTPQLYWNVIIDLQMTESLDRTIASHRKLEEDMRDSNEKKDAVAHWEAQIAEIIQWYGFFSLNWFRLLILWYF